MKGMVFVKVRFNKYVMLALLVMMVVIFTACSKQKTAEDAPVKIGMIPVVDNLPLWVAEEEGYFADAGVEVELIPFDSAVEKDSAIAAQQIDGGLGDILTLASLNGSGVPVKIIAIAQGNTAEEGIFFLLSAPGSGITEPGQLKNVEVAVSLNSVIEYVTDQMLLSQGFDQEEIKKLSIPKIPPRLEALLNGQVKAAVLPEPSASIAVLNGAQVVMDDSFENVSQSVIYFHQSALEDKEEQIKAMMRAYARAVEDIQSKPAAFNHILVEKARVHQDVLDQQEKTSFRILFSQPELPAEKHIQDVVRWMLDRDLLHEEPAYEDLVDQRVLR